MKVAHQLVALSLCFASVDAGAAPLSASLLSAHNAERAQVGLRPIVWDERLAAEAAAYASELARTGHWGHAPAHRRPGQGENLWMGTRGAFSSAKMVGEWTDEKRSFRPGIFPYVSRTGSWADVAHYTQIIWPTTTRVGCSIRSSAHDDYLVCRYSNPGNMMGKPVGSRSMASL